MLQPRAMLARAALRTTLGAAFFLAWSAHAGCSGEVNTGECDDEYCGSCEDGDCEPEPEPEPECPLDCARPGDPEECGAPCEESECTLPSDLADLELGTGEQCFERLRSDLVVPQMEGPQGGYHMWLSLYCADCPSEILLETRLVREDTEEVVSDLTGSLRPVQLETVTGVIVPLPGSPWDPESPPLPEGTRVVLSASIKTPTGALLHEAQDTRVLGAFTYWDYCATNPEDPCCVQLCDGRL
jgi:hypothetical protein